MKFWILALLLSCFLSLGCGANEGTSLVTENADADAIADYKAAVAAEQKAVEAEE